MINSIHASVTFITPIKTTKLVVDYEPQPGITAVIGRNGSGKSWSVLEVPRFLLFGKKALRGVAGDYKSMDATGVFTLNGGRIKIERNARRERITDEAGTVIAVGAEAVTAKVIELLGYGLEVFDLANASVQKQADKLGQLRPAQRKELIDRVVGLTDYETVEKTCREESKGFRREAEALAKVLRAPGDEPEKPKDYRQPDEIRADLAAGRAKLAEWAKLNAQVYRGMPPVAPMMPKPESWEISQIEEQEQARLSVEQERRRLESIMQKCRRYVADALPETELVKAEARNVAKAAIAARGAPPTLALPVIEAELAAWAVFEAYKPSPEITCPKCDHKFRTTGEAPPRPTYEKETLRADRARWSKWEDGAEIALPAGPDLTPQEIKLHRESIAADAEFNEAAAALQALKAPVNQSDLLAALRGAVPAWAAYEERVAEHTRRVAASAAAEAALEALGPRPTDEEGEALQWALSRAEHYDREIARYLDDRAHFEQQTLEIERLSKMAEKFKEGGEALADARATLKAHLAPLLSRVASSLIFDMTAGDLQSVVVDDDMEITVDGQRIETLSGAGETVANLALRIALGQVLVGDSFPVFLGDEIDSDADDQRRAATKLALTSLKSKLTQIILVSHRQIDIADHVLDLDVTG